MQATDDQDVLEIEAEDVGSRSLVSSLVATLASQHGNAYYRFVGRARSNDPRWPSYSVTGATFPVMRPSLDDLEAQGGWLDTIMERVRDLRDQLEREGWRPAGRGEHWWSYRYTRPSLASDSSAIGGGRPAGAGG